ncbi:hypothetical protein [Rhizobium ruizarguesonis]|uniref:hypothetical protein n=1 Tax=Rhizobium ruizarguesonis TaxID=2081791 RepID=UPI0010311DA5|nr:hypothetical protein [Rhizobium ruizarguesonis]TBD71604.1 hypothetical protein ELH11_38560 [Rhizobium ruizarguesonis]TBD94846.1 hypothetical protein ELH09_38280 [Rhizobium ruizarguesonis]TBE14536.1 hypothetical protein ELH07_38350 [Rhizobium ruizarguesonis]TBE14705.1 hypothetical protein ELH08_38895 [Rhizobium ruizarguesonis]WSH04972.1 hypothetical protein U8P71_34675 [Rhizobium ruizarguesonis]
MEPATFVVTALAGALLKEVAVDSYQLVKTKLVEVFGLTTPLTALEEAPGDEDARTFLSKRLVSSKAVDDPQILSGVEKIIEALAQLPDDTPIFASLNVRGLKAEAAEFRRNRIGAGGAANFEQIELSGRLTVEDNQIGDDRKR